MEQQLVILVIIGLISLVNWLMQRSAEIREKRKHEREAQGIPEGNPFQPADEPAPAAPRQNPGEGMRKLMEALGVPIEEPPQRLWKESAQPQRYSEPPALVEALPKPKPPAPPAQAQCPAPALAQHPASAGAISHSLRSCASVRQAIVLREVLGPPRALCPWHRHRDS